ncbi:MAG TPA: YncE family protein [Rhizomicrobium sp.]
MRNLPPIAGLLALLAAGGGYGAEALAHTQPLPFGKSYSLVGDFPLGAATERMDYQSVDSAARRLYIAKMGSGQLLVFDTGLNTLLNQLDGFAKITGILAVPELHRVYASVPGAGIAASVDVGLGMIGLSPGHGAIAVLDTTNLKELARLPGGVFPDGIAFDPVNRRVFVSDELGSAVLAFDATQNRPLGHIAMGGEVGNVQYDPFTARIYAPIQSRDELAVIDPVKITIVARHSLAGCRHPHGLAIAPDAAIGYVACDANDVLLTVDLATGRVLGEHAVAHDPDVLAIDPSAKRLFVASESGTLSAFDISTARSPVALGDVFVADGAHSVAVDPATHRLYFPLANLAGRAVMRVLSPRP